MTAKSSKTVKSNIKKYILFQALYSTAAVLTTGAVIQAFFGYLGLEDSASLYASVIQIIQVASMMICSLWCDRIKSIIRAVGISVCVIGVISASLVFVCLGVPADTYAAYIFILAVSCISSVGLGIYKVLVYKLPFEIYDINEFGKYSAFCGIASGICGFLCTSLISVLSGIFDYILVITAFFSVALALFVISAAVCFSLEKIPYSDKSKKVKINLLSYPEFTKLIPANLLRGIGEGIIGLMTVIGMKDGILNETTAVHVAAVSVLGSVSGFLLYLLASKFMSVKTLTLITSFFAVLGFPLTVLLQTPMTLYITYYLSYACVIALGNCVPVLVYGGVPQGVIGKYTAWRMLLFTFGNAVPGFFMNALLDGIGAVAVMLIGGLCTAACGILYVIVLGKNVVGSTKKAERGRGRHAEDYIKRDANGNMYLTDPVTGERRMYEVDEKGLYKNLNTGTVYTEEELISMLNAKLQTVTVQKKKKPSAKAQKKAPESKESAPKEKARYERKSYDEKTLSADLESDILDSSIEDLAEKETLGKCYAPRLEDAYANDKRVSCAIAMAGFDSITDINLDKLEKAGFTISKKLGTKEIEEACNENKVRLSADDLEKCIASGITEEGIGAMKHVDALACDNIRKAERILSLDDDLKELATIEPLEWTIDNRQKSL